MIDKMKTCFWLVLFALVLVGGNEGRAATAQGPIEQLRPVLDGLTQILADESLAGDAHRTERRAKIMDQIKQGFDFTEMSKRVLGKSWRSITAEEREYFTELMTKLLENVYIGKLEGYSGQTVTYAGEKIKGKRAQMTTFVKDENLEIPVHYILHLQGSKWMVYDINIEGVSLVRNYQQQFKSILRKEKFAGLVKVLEDKNRSFAAENQ